MKEIESHILQITIRADKFRIAGKVIEMMKAGHVNWDEMDETINGMPDGEAKNEAYVNAIRLADEQKEVYYQLYFRFRYASYVTFHDDPTKAIPLAAEFANIFEANALAMEKRRMQSAYLWTTLLGLDSICNLPQIPKEQWEKMMDGCKKLVKRYHMGSRMYWWQMCNFYYYIDEEKAFECFQKAWASKRDILTDCGACECSSAVRIYLLKGDREQADYWAAELKAGKFEECNDAEPKMQMYYLQDALKRGDFEEAAPLADKLYPYANESKNELEFLGTALQCFAYTNPDTALKIVEERLEWALQIYILKWRYDFYKGAWLTFHELAKTKETVKLSLTEQFPLWNSQNTYSVRELEQWFFTQAQKLAERFDKRNGTDYFAKDMEKHDIINLLQ